MPKPLPGLLGRKTPGRRWSVFRLAANGEKRPVADLIERGHARDMDTWAQAIHFTVRRPWNASELIFLVGPGCAGKSTLGRSLAPVLGRTLIDLDETFLVRIGDIGAFIRDEGYEAYKTTNSKLAAAIVDETRASVVLVTSSGFLTADNPPDVLATNHALLARGYSVSLMPSSEIEDAVATIVTRQMTRSYNGGVEREEATARARFMTYMVAGDLLVCSAATPDAVAKALRAHLT